jgi:hypothetical protein
MCSEKKENIPLLRSFDDLFDSSSINISSLRDDKESPSTHDDPITQFQSCLRAISTRARICGLSRTFIPQQLKLGLILIFRAGQ